MRSRSILTSAAFATLFATFAACSSVHTPVAVRPGAGASAMAGVWMGTYGSRDTGRSGDIYLALSARADSAVGEVVMNAGNQPVIAEMQPDGTWRWRGRSASMPEVILIQFVEIQTGEIEGQLAPYLDPSCGCLVRTTFRGRVDGDRVSGTFHSEGEAPAHRAEGTWSAERR